MKRFVRYGVFMACALALGIPVRAQSVRPATSDGAEPTPRNLFYLHTRGVVVIRLHARVGGGRFDARWRDHVQDVFQQVDADRDGRLSVAERSAELSREATAVLGVPDLDLADEDPLDGAISFAELTRFLENTGHGPFRLFRDATGNAAQRNQPGEHLFLMLDRNEDRQISSRELDADDLRRFDLDDDGLFSAAELRRVSRPVLNLPRRAADLGLFMIVPAGTAPGRVVDELVKRYGPAPRDGVRATDVPRGGLRLSDEEFARLDLDRSDSLDYTELRRFVAAPAATAELRVDLPREKAQQPVVAVVGQPADWLEVRRGAGLVSLAVDDVQIEIHGSVFDPKSFSTYYEAVFSSADRDANGYIDKMEVRRSVLRRAFAEIDVDDDGKLFREELDKAVESQTAMAQRRLRLSVVDRGRNLFTIMDRNGDGRVSPRELDETRPRVGLWDDDGDDVIRRSEVPQTYVLSFGPGVPDLPGAPAARVGATGQASAAELQRPGTREPVWFFRMDRNGDGEVSRREFPGTRIEFLQLDKDASGFVSRTEALAAGQPDR